jgi:hypothetical protein
MIHYNETKRVRSIHGLVAVRFSENVILCRNKINGVRERESE